MHPTGALRLPGPLVLVPARSFAGKFAEVRRQFPNLPEPGVLLPELNRLTALGGVPAVWETSRQGRRSLQLYTADVRLGLYPSSHNDAWFIAYMEPIRLRDHAALARGVLRLAPQRWAYQPVLAQLPRGHRNFQPEIENAWSALVRSTTARDTTPATSTRHDQFCDDLDDVIEAGRQIDAAKQRQAPPIPYYAVDSAAEQRSGTAGVYVFHLARPGGAERGTLVELRNAPDLRGTVRRAEGEQLTVQFAGAVDRRRISEQGELVISANSVIPRVQQAAVRALRERSTVNPRLLPLLVEGAFTPYRQLADDLPGPAEPLDLDQSTAFRRALAGPDMLMVLGPPGTGKTRTIVEIARACAARGERVLVTSHTNTAVDNVLERLPEQVRGLRVGNDERISSAVRPMTLPLLAAGLQRQILDRTTADAARLRPWLDDPSPADAWLSRLARALGEATQARTQREAAEHQWHAELHRVEAPFRNRLAACETAVADADRAHRDAYTRAGHLTATLAVARRREHGMLGFIYRPIVRRRAERLATAGRDAAAAEQARLAAQRDLAGLRAVVHAAGEADPRAHHARQQVKAGDRAIARALEQAGQSARELRRLLAAVLPTPAEPAGDAGALAAFHQWAHESQPLIRARAVLLRDWRTKLAEPTEDLHNELVRYADVIGATCIGVGIAGNLIADLEFDVAIVDEAGQISLPSTLVPLVRARRAILVGDHHQLPPFVDDEVHEWLSHRAAGNGGSVDPGRLTGLLSTSAFERLYGLAPDTHRILLRRQRRMPAAIADFVSAQFYDGRLTTGSVPRPAPPPFGRPLAIVDTSDLPAGERAERERRRTETWQAAGYDNPAEAGLVLDLVQWYARTGRTWAVIVPYRAQVQLLTARLSTMLGNETVVTDNVGTVDAFQGGERDIICYSFTRSNRTGRVGFLSELRRINVAITRARQQLVLIGDLTTLSSAQDMPFRELTRALQRHTARHGEIHRSRAVADLLREAWKAVP